MVQIGSRVDICAHCTELAVVGEFWNVEPRFRVFICAPCLEQCAGSVRAAASRLAVPEEARR
jgi:hypothetical protein